MGKQTLRLDGKNSKATLQKGHGYKGRRNVWLLLATSHRLHGCTKFRSASGAQSRARAAGDIQHNTLRRHQNASKRDAFTEVTLNFPQVIYKVHHWKYIRCGMVIKLKLLVMHPLAH